MNQIHHTKSRNTAPAASGIPGLIVFFQDVTAAVSAAVRRHRTLRAVAPVPPERLIDCGIDPSLSRNELSSREDRIVGSLMSMR